MRRTYTYRQAVVLLGGESRLARILDKASAVALLGMGAFDLLDARMEASKLADSLIRNLRDRVKGLARYDRTDRLAAAHGVIVVTAYFEALGELELRVASTLTREDRERMVGRDPVGHWVEQLVAADLPLPSPQAPHETLLAELEDRYGRFSADLLGLVSGLAVWERWDVTERSRVRTELRENLPRLALRRYEEHFRQLVGDFPEVAAWVGLTEHQATREAVAYVREGLAGLEEHLARITSGRTPRDRLAALIRENRAALDRTIISADDVPADMTIPRLGLAYFNPGYRLLPPGRDRNPADESAWRNLPRRDDLNEFLFGHLTTPQATWAPLLVLGQPGAGKSVLTKVLAARLPAGDFLPLRVELRGVPADADLLAQIEHAIRAALDESMSWPELVHEAEGALPVVMMDGFDELLQATGVSRTDYLEKIVEFQRRQAERGRPLAVIVTSRTAVAGRARLPHETPVLRLEPFNEEQIEGWIKVWNTANQRYFARRSLRPLSLRHVLAVPELAAQPLLLLMLALYDADANALRLAGEGLNEAELYERLLVAFTEREVHKSHPGLSGPDLSRAVEEALLNLSITAFAMFNRGRQWVTEEDLDEDLGILVPSSSGPPADASGFRRPLTAAEEVIGGFFFVHRAQALRDDERLKTYEFLHATFGEYLIARLITRELADLAEELAFARSRNRPTKPDDSFLYALLSFAVLTTRANVPWFIEYGIARRVPDDKRDVLVRHLCESFTDSLETRTGNPYDAYRPVHAVAPRRYAVYSANLLLLGVLTADRPLRGSDLFPREDSDAIVTRWHAFGRLWHSQCEVGEWLSLTDLIRVGYRGRGPRRELSVRMNGEGPYRVGESLYQFDAFDQEHLDHRVVPGTRVARLLVDASFMGDDQNFLLGMTPILPFIDSRYVESYTVLGGVRGLQAISALEVLLLDPAHAGVDRILEVFRWAIMATPVGSTLYGHLVLTRFEKYADGIPTADLLDFINGIVSFLHAPPHRELVRRVLDRLSERGDVDAEKLRRTYELLDRMSGQEELR